MQVERPTSGGLSGGCIMHWIFHPPVIVLYGDEMPNGLDHLGLVFKPSAASIVSMVEYRPVLQRCGSGSFRFNISEMVKSVVNRVRTLEFNAIQLKDRVMVTNWVKCISAWTSPKRYDASCCQRGTASVAS